MPHLPFQPQSNQHGQAGTGLPNPPIPLKSPHPHLRNQCKSCSSEKNIFSLPLQAKIAEMVSGAVDGATLFIHYSGHGCQISGTLQHLRVHACRQP